MSIDRTAPPSEVPISPRTIRIGIAVVLLLLAAVGAFFIVREV
jgi:hypothetical protein